MTATLISLNIGMPKIIGRWHGEEVLSGFDKQPVPAGSVFVGRTAIAGDGQADLVYHGGEDKAVYAYPAANWAWWEEEKRLACRPGLFGENLTLGGFDETSIHIGDRFAWGEAVLEVSQPRAPCYKLGVYTDRADIPQAMLLSGRCGWYFRVIKEGNAPAKGVLTRLVCANTPSVRESFTAVFGPKPDIVLLHRLQAAPGLAPAWQRQVEKRIAVAKR